MSCPSCGRETLPNAFFCTFCGSSLSGYPDTQEEGRPPEEVTQAPREHGEGDTIEAQVHSLQGAVTSIRANLSRLSSRLSALELVLGLPADAEPARPRVSTAGPSPQPAGTKHPSPPSSLVERGARGAWSQLADS